MKTTKAIILIASIAFISNVGAQSINVNQYFTSDAEIFPFDPNDTIYGLSITGSVTLNSDTSLVRIILADTNYYEYMAYEAYPLIVDTFSFDTTGVCDETCYL
ncbi:MAG: hypothetical protein K9G67_00865, partial [Bacteroidales bacterium]|nr:hypothetical protein [Bacteroidales bacterium]MCF8374883.1 hypothetical protein [Bacteroidales bacterium]